MMNALAKKIFNLLKRPLILVLLVLAIIFLFQRLHILPEFKNWFKSKPLLIENTPLVIKEVKQIAELHTAQLYAEIVVDSSYLNTAGLTNQALRSVGMLTLPVSENNTLVIIARGKVRAGINLKQLNDTNVIVLKDSIHIVLPRAQILDVIINPADFDIFIQEGEWPANAVQLVKQKAASKLLAEANRQQLLVQAEEKAKVVLTQFLKTAGFNRISIEISH